MKCVARLRREVTFANLSTEPPRNQAEIEWRLSRSYVSGPHNVKFGFDYNRSHVDQFFRGNWRGVYIFNNIATFVANLNKVPGAAPDQFRITALIAARIFVICFSTRWKKQ